MISIRWPYEILKTLGKDLPQVDNCGIGIMTMELFQSFHCWQYLVNNRNTKQKCEICSKSIKNQNDVIVNFENISPRFCSVSNADFEQVNVSFEQVNVDWWQWVVWLAFWIETLKNLRSKFFDSRIYVFHFFWTWHL